jgi:hypothetical protein
MRPRGRKGSLLEAVLPSVGGKLLRRVAARHDILLIANAQKPREVWERSSRIQN